MGGKGGGGGGGGGGGKGRGKGGGRERKGGEGRGRRGLKTQPRPQNSVSFPQYLTCAGPLKPLVNPSKDIMCSPMNSTKRSHAMRGIRSWREEGPFTQNRPVQGSEGLHLKAHEVLFVKPMFYSGSP